MRIRLFLILTLLFCTGCRSDNLVYPYKDHQALVYQEPEVIDKPPTPERPDAVSQVELRMNQDLETTWSAALEALRKRGFPLQVADTDSGVIETDWILMSGGFCETAPQAGAPIRCQIKYVINCERITKDASGLSILYKQRCETNKKFETHCPGSPAEKTMLEIADEVAPDLTRRPWPSQTGQYY